MVGGVQFHSGIAVEKPFQRQTVAAQTHKHTNNVGTTVAQSARLDGLEKRKKKLQQKKKNKQSNRKVKIGENYLRIH